MRDNLGPRDLQSVPLKPGWREYQTSKIPMKILRFQTCLIVLANCNARYIHLNLSRISINKSVRRCNWPPNTLHLIRPVMLLPLSSAYKAGMIMTRSQFHNSLQPMHERFAKPVAHRQVYL
jgi:hypothetical protein